MSAFFDAILPIFLLVALGALAAHRRLVDRPLALALNRFVLLFAVPALLFRIAAQARVDAEQWPLIATAFGAELTVYALGVWAGRRWLGLPWRGAILTGFTSAFANHVLLVLPIGIALYGEAAMGPMVGLITFDVLLVYVGTLLWLDVAGADGQNGRGTLATALSSAVGNPALWAVALGSGVNALDLTLPAGVDLYTEMIAGTAGPCALIALGIILSQPLEPRDAGLSWRLSGVVVALKLVVHPVLLLVLVAALGTSWSAALPVLLVGAAPAGAMALVFASRFEVLVEPIARAILITTVLAVVTVTVVVIGVGP